MSIDLNIDPALSGGLHRKPSESDPERPDGFIMVTPQSEVASWGTISTDPVPTPGTLPPSLIQKNNNAWMGADLDSHDIGHLATIHFPELRDISGLNEGEGEQANSHLDFMNLGGDEWKDWQPNNGTLGTGDLDGFPPVNGFSSQFPTTPGKFDQAITAGFGETN
jgi:hypothetical protein